MVQVYRKLGLHDRYSMARCNIGFAPVVAVVSTLNIPDTDSSIEVRVSKIYKLLSSRIAKLLEVVPLLSCHVTDTKTREPKFCRSDRQIKDEDIIQTNQLPSSERFELEGMIAKQWRLGVDTLKADQGPLWRVDIHYQADSKTVWIGLAINHVMTDGKGCFNLYQLLISPQVDLSKELSQSEIELVRGVKEIPDASDVAYNMKPGLALTLPILFKTLVVPHLPSFIQGYFRDKHYWPYKLEKTIKECEGKRILLQIKEKNFIKDLKEVCRTVGSMKTIHSTIASSVMVGILSLALAQEDARFPGDGARPEEIQDNEGNITIKVDTPINIRKPETGVAVGNFVSGFMYSKELNKDSLFWKITKEHDEAQNSEAGRKMALSYLGLMDLIPESDKIEPTELEPTGWERYFNSKKSYGASFSISNLGAMPSLLLTDPSHTDLAPIPVEEIAWTQTPSIFSAALSIDMCGLMEDKDGNWGGLSISIGFRDGPLSEEAVRKVKQVIGQTLMKVVQGQVGKDAKIGDLIQ